MIQSASVRRDKAEVPLAVLLPATDLTVMEFAHGLFLCGASGAGALPW